MATKSDIRATKDKQQRPIKRFFVNLVKSDNFIFTFLRSFVSSQASSLTDLGSSIFLKFLGVSMWLATPIGATLGGIVNCCLCYKITFRAKGLSWRAVAVKYLLVWLGSMGLNTVGTALLTMTLDRWPIMEALGWTDLGNYSTARLLVALLVSLFWNFLLQRYFVYRQTRFDPYAINAVDWIAYNMHIKHRPDSGDEDPEVDVQQN